MAPFGFGAEQAAFTAHASVFSYHDSSIATIPKLFWNVSWIRANVGTCSIGKSTP
jgi:hypothetical protein